MKRPIPVVFFLLYFSLASAQMMNVRKWRNTERDSLDNALLLLDEKYFAQALPIFENLLANHPREEFLKYSYGKCALYRPDRHEQAYRYLFEIFQKNKKLPEIPYEIALAALYNYRFDEAEQFLQPYFANKRISPEDRARAEILQKNIYWGRQHYNQPTKVKIRNLGPAVNTRGEEYVPAITADESVLVYTYFGEKSKGGRQIISLQEDLQLSLYMEDIYLSEKKKGVFQQAAPIDSLNTDGPDAAISLSNDGNALFIYRDVDDGGGDLYMSRRSGRNYSAPQKLKGKINSYSWEGHCSLSPDGKTMFFSSDRANGFGGKDLYRATLGEDSVWTNIVNLGLSVNTPFDEDAPFIHADGKTLYFSSKGHSSMGGYDIFKSTMAASDSAFRQIEHLGYPLNSPSDDIYFVLAANGKSGYYSSSRKDGLGLRDIYQVEPDFTGAAPLLLVRGVLRHEGKPVRAKVTVKQKSSGRDYGEFYSSSGTGEYLIALPAGEVYQAVYTHSGSAAQTFYFSTAGLQRYEEKNQDISFADKKEVVAKINTAPVPAPVKADAGDFVPQSKLQAKTMRYVEKYGDVQQPGMEFKIQITALKNDRKYYFPNLAKYGRIEKLSLGDGFTRLMIGGSFKTIRKAFALNKKIVKAGYKDAFVVAFYNGKRVQYEDLEKMGFFK